MPRIALQKSVLEQLRDKVLRARGVAFDMEDDGQVYAMLKYFADEIGRAAAGVSVELPKEAGSLVTSTKEFLQTLQSEL